MEKNFFLLSSDLQGKVVFVTGAARGLGRAMALGAAQAGAAVALADVNWDALCAADLAREFGPYEHFVQQLDISDLKSCETSIGACLARFGKIDVLINNAGRGPNFVSASPKSRSLKFWEADPERWSTLIQTNVVGTFYMSQVAAKLMIEVGWGRIINISTSLATMHRPQGSPYGVSKAAIDTQSIIWARDLAGTGVTVNILLPGGAADTDFVTPDMRVAAQSGAAILHKPTIMVAPMIWLASDSSSGFSGVRLVAAKWDESKPLGKRIEDSIEPAILRGVGT